VDAQKIEAAFHQRFPDSILTVDSYVGGEPARLVVGGLPPIPGQTVNDQRLYLSQHLDEVRLRLTREPRGHRDMFASILTQRIWTPGAIPICAATPLWPPLAR
jgi:proline racemase